MVEALLTWNHEWWVSLDCEFDNWKHHQAHSGTQASLFHQFGLDLCSD
jgi:hypothetical protein